MQNFESKRTIYKGICFRSKLEARWAVVFDKLGIEWVYEPDTLSRDWDGMVYYRPDFYLPNFDFYVEVKPNDDKLQERAIDIGQLVDWDGPLAKGLIIVGVVPNSTMITNRLPFFSLVYNYKAVVLDYVTFTDRGIYRPSNYSYIDSCEGDDGLPEGTSTHPIWFKAEDLKNSFSAIRAAYDAGWFSNEMEAG